MTTPSDGGLRPMFRERLRQHWHWQSIETAAVVGGVPDSNYCCQGIEGWCEFKATRAWSVKFRPTQPGWIYRRCRAGGRVWVPVRRWHTTGPEETDELWMVPGRCVIPLVRGGLREVRSVSSVWGGGPRHWDWEVVGRLLLSSPSVVVEPDC